MDCGIFENIHSSQGRSFHLSRCVGEWSDGTGAEFSKRASVAGVNRTQMAEAYEALKAGDDTKMISGKG